MNTPQETIELVKKWLDDPESVSKEELQKAAYVTAADDAYAAAYAAYAAAYAAADAAYAAADAAYAAAYAAYAAADAAYAAAYAAARADADFWVKKFEELSKMKNKTATHATNKNSELEAAAIALFLSMDAEYMLKQPLTVQRLWGLGERLHSDNKLEGEG